MDRTSHTFSLLKDKKHMRKMPEPTFLFCHLVSSINICLLSLSLSLGFSFSFIEQIRKTIDFLPRLNLRRSTDVLMHQLHLYVGLDWYLTSNQLTVSLQLSPCPTQAKDTKRKNICSWKSILFFFFLRHKRLLWFDCIIDVDLHPKMADNQQEECIKSLHMPKYQQVFHRVLF